MLGPYNKKFLEKGMTLIEALVSTAIVAIGFIAIFQMVSYSVQAVDVSNERTKTGYLTSMVAEDLLADRYADFSGKKLYEHMVSNRPTTGDKNTWEMASCTDGSGAGTTASNVLAEKINKTSKEILKAASYLEINVKSNISILNNEEVKKIIKYFRKKRILLLLRRYSSLFIIVFFFVSLYFIINSETALSGEVYASIDEQGELTLDWDFGESVDSGEILIETESELYLIEVGDKSGTTIECCYDEDLAISLFLTGQEDEEVEVQFLNVEVLSSTTTTSTTTTTSSTTTTLPPTTTSSTTSTTLVESSRITFPSLPTKYIVTGGGSCKYTLVPVNSESPDYSSGMSKDQADETKTALENECLSSPITSTTTTSTTTTTIPDPSSSISQSLSSCSGPSGTRTSTLNLTNNETYTAYYLIEYSTNSGSSYSIAQPNQSISGGNTNTANSVVVSDGSSIIWRFKDSRTSNDFSNASYEILSVVTVDCPGGYYVNVDGSNTYALTMQCKKWKNSTKPQFEANPWWGSYSTAKSYMFALIALTGDYDDNDGIVEESDYFDYSPFDVGSSNCFGIVNGAYFAYEISNDQWMGPIISAPVWNSQTQASDWDRRYHEQYIFAELVP